MKMENKKSKFLLISVFALSCVFGTWGCMPSQIQSSANRQSTGDKSVASSFPGGSTADEGLEGNLGDEVESSAQDVEENCQSPKMEEVFAKANNKVASWQIYDDHIIVILSGDDAYFAASANIDDNTRSKIESANDDMDEVRMIIEVLPSSIVREFDLPSANELDMLVGKTASELVDAGYVFSNEALVFSRNKTTAIMAKDMFSYRITFDGLAGNSMTSEPMTALGPLLVSSVKVEDLLPIAISNLSE